MLGHPKCFVDGDRRSHISGLRELFLFLPAFEAAAAICLRAGPAPQQEFRDPCSESSNPWCLLACKKGNGASPAPQVAIWHPTPLTPNCVCVWGGVSRSHKDDPKTHTHTLVLSFRLFKLEKVV